MAKENVESVEQTVEETVEGVKEYTPEEILNDIKEGQKELTELDDDQRDILIYDFNQKNEGIAKLETEKPDQEFIDMCKKEFETYQDEYTKVSYNVTGKEKALEYAKWLKEWNSDRVIAPSSYWIGVLKFDEVISETIKKIEENKEEVLDFDYGALTYTYNLMMSPMGVGIEYAKWMAENQETYNTILNKLGEHIDMINLIKKKIGILQSRWALACSGFKMTILLEKLEDYKNVDLSNI